MKKIVLALLAFTFLARVAAGQSGAGKNYYAVIGAFAKLDNATRYTEKAKNNKFDAHYEINPDRKLYYVYILSTPELRKAYAFVIKTRVETEYKDCWIFVGALGEKPAVVEVVKPPVEPVVVVETPKEPVVTFEPVVTIDSSTLVKKEPEVPKPPVKKPEGKAYLFKLVNDASGSEVVGEVQVYEASHAEQYQAFQGNQVVYIKPPGNKDGTFQIITRVPGYQEVKSTIVYTDPGSSTGSEGEAVIELSLKPAKRGDYIDFNDVKFVRNSSIMAPESQNELDGLVALMKENAKYKIKIHGHCNGKKDREVIDIGTSTKYFAMDPSANKKETSTAKVLSLERANAVKGYMVSQGISADRISTVGEGGRIPLYPETSTLASYNDRVEIEVKKR